MTSMELRQQIFETDVLEETVRAILMLARARNTKRNPRLYDTMHCQWRGHRRRLVKWVPKATR